MESREPGEVCMLTFIESGMHVFDEYVAAAILSMNLQRDVRKQCVHWSEDGG